MQSYFFPYIGYFQLIDSVDVFIIYEHVTFRKKSWITRNRILDKGSQSPIFINIPVIGKSAKKIINDIQIDEDSDWKKKILNLVFFNYKKAPFFNEIYPFIEKMMLMNDSSIHNYNSCVLIKICELLDIKTKIIYNNSEDVEVELLGDKGIQKEEVKTERILKICKKYNATKYINPIGGTELYSKESFINKNLELAFVKTNEHSYSQFDKDFTPYLSIIDMLMHIGVKETKKIIKDYELV